MQMVHQQPHHPNQQPVQKTISNYFRFRAVIYLTVILAIFLTFQMMTDDRPTPDQQHSQQFHMPPQQV